jgi:hypothetical protein
MLQIYLNNFVIQKHSIVYQKGSLRLLHPIFLSLTHLKCMTFRSQFAVRFSHIHLCRFKMKRHSIIFFRNIFIGRPLISYSLTIFGSNSLLPIVFHISFHSVLFILNSKSQCLDFNCKSLKTRLCPGTVSSRDWRRHMVGLFPIKALWRFLDPSELTRRVTLRAILPI